MNKQKKKTFSQILSELKPVQKEELSEKIPVIKENPDRQPFRWVFLPGRMALTHSDFGWNRYNGKKSTENFFDFLEKIEKVLHDKFINMTFGEVCKLPHCGYYNFGLNERQKSLLREHFPRNEEDDFEKVFHVALKGKHRLLGYVQGGTFYVVFNDSKHKFNEI